MRMRRYLLVLALTSTVAAAQGVDELAHGLATNPRTYLEALGLLAIGWLIRSRDAEKDGRLSDTRAFAESLAQAREKSAVLVQRLSDFTGTLEELVRLLTSER